jgi:hypothetical protein
MGKCAVAALACVLLMAVPQFAAAQDALTESDEPTLHIFTNRAHYEGGERGFVVLVLETHGKMQSAEIEIEVLSESGNLVEGDILHTKIPMTSIVNQGTKQTVQLMYDESITYFGPEKTVYRTVDFEVPMDISTGRYTITGRVTSPGIVLNEEASIYITGPGGFLDVMFLVYIAALVCSFYLLRRA